MLTVSAIIVQSAYLRPVDRSTLEKKNGFGAHFGTHYACAFRQIYLDKHRGPPEQANAQGSPNRVREFRDGVPVFRAASVFSRPNLLLSQAPEAGPTRAP